MPPLSQTNLVTLLHPYLAAAPEPPLLQQLTTYLDLLLKWNARTNLTAIRDPAQIVARHFGESLFAARQLPPATRTVLDLGSGAGFPGLPFQLLRPDLAVTLAESQGKKAAFLREVVRTLHLPTAVHSARAETLPPHSFDCVTLRAVDDMDLALPLATRLATQTVLLLTTNTEAEALGTIPVAARTPLPGSTDRICLLLPAPFAP